MANTDINISDLPDAGDVETNDTLVIDRGGVTQKASYSGVTAPVGISDGGTGATDAGTARTNLGLQIGADVQAYDADLDALSAFSGTGFVARTGSNTFSLRELTGETNEINVADADGVSANPTIGLADNPILPGSGSVGIPTGTTAERPGSPTAGFLRWNTDNSEYEFYDGANWGTFIIDDEVSGTGITVKTSNSPITYTTRSIDGTANQIDVTNGDGIGGNPTVALTDPVILNQLDIQSAIRHDGDTDTTISATTDTWTINTGGSERAKINNNGFELGNNGNAVTEIIDDDTMSSAAATNIATSESIKAYVDSGARDFVLLATASPSGVATVDFDSNIDSTYDLYWLEFKDMTPSSDFVPLVLRFQIGGSTWKEGSTDYTYAGHNIEADNGNESIVSSNADLWIVIGNAVGSSTNENINGQIWIWNANTNDRIAGASTASAIVSDGNLLSCTRRFASNFAGSPLTGLRLLFTSGNIESGTLQLMGVKK